MPRGRGKGKSKLRRAWDAVRTKFWLQVNLGILSGGVSIEKPPKEERRRGKSRSKAKKAEPRVGKSTDQSQIVHALTGLAHRSVHELLAEDLPLTIDTVFRRMSRLEPGLMRSLVDYLGSEASVRAYLPEILQKYTSQGRDLIRIPFPVRRPKDLVTRFGMSRASSHLLAALIVLTIAVASLYLVAAYFTMYDIWSELTLFIWAQDTPWMDGWIDGLFWFGYFGVLIVDALVLLVLLVFEARWKGIVWNFRNPEEVAVFPRRGVIGVRGEYYWPGRVVRFFSSRPGILFLLIAYVAFASFYVSPLFMYLAELRSVGLGISPNEMLWLVGGPVLWLIWPLWTIDLSERHMKRVKALFDNEEKMLNRALKDAGVSV